MASNLLAEGRSCTASAVVEANRCADLDATFKAWVRSYSLHHVVDDKKVRKLLAKVMQMEGAVVVLLGELHEVCTTDAAAVTSQQSLCVLRVLSTVAG